MLYYSIIFLVTALGETFGAMFGGGSFFIQPALLALGIDPKIAIANDVAAAGFASLGFIYSYKIPKGEMGRVCKKISVFMVPFALIGAVLGGHTLQLIPEDVVRWCIIVICCLGSIYTFFKISSNKQEDSQPIEEKRGDHCFIGLWPLFGIIGALFLGFYDGISGAGSGIILLTILTFVFRQDMKTTLFVANVISAASLLMAGATFWYLGLLRWDLLLCMIPACFIGGMVAANITKIVPEKSLRVIYGVLVFALLLYLLYGQFLST